MLPEKQIQKVHFQITKTCNLRCPFCGQWGEQGFFSETNGKPLSYEKWVSLAKELKELSQKPEITLWGGEPLCCPFFDELTEKLFGMGFEISVITNGTMIKEHIKVINKYVEKVYVSIDGLCELHDSIRGKGVFKKVDENIKLIDASKIRIMTVATPILDIKAFAKYFSEYKILLQNLIALNSEEISIYKSWMQKTFGIAAKAIEAWKGEAYSPCYDKLPSNVTFLPHGNKVLCCNSPYSHIHIAWNGNLLYCTDFYDFAAGNVMNFSITELFNNEKSELFRREIEKGNNPACNHCSWKNNLNL